MAEPQEPTPEYRSTHVFVGVALGLAFLGFFVGINQTSQQMDGLTAFVPDASKEAPHESLKARGYGEILENPFRKNQHWLTSIDNLASKTTPQLTAEVEDPEKNKESTLLMREARRAYAGAPPTIPHPVKQKGDASCVACHQDGVTINGRLAPPMSHDFKSQCMQCHVVSQAPMQVENRSYLLSTENSFVGLSEPRDGERAWPGAPATIPHTLQMRSNCMSCHGLNGRYGIRTSHPWRQNCVQCHTPNAKLDAHPIPSNLDAPPQ